MSILNDFDIGRLVQGIAVFIKIGESRDALVAFFRRVEGCQIVADGFPILFEKRFLRVSGFDGFRNHADSVITQRGPGVRCYVVGGFEIVGNDLCRLVISTEEKGCREVGAFGGGARDFEEIG